MSKYKAHELLYLNDVDRFIELGHIHQQECEPDLGFSEVVARANVWMTFEDMSRASLNMWVARKDGEIIGYAIGRIDRFVFSDAKLATLHMWYVLPDHRKTRAAFELLAAFENWAKLQGAARIEIGAARSMGGDTTEVNRMFTKRNFKRYGELFYRELN